MLSKTQEKELLKFSSFYLKTARHLRIEVIRQVQNTMMLPSIYFMHYKTVKLEIIYFNHTLNNVLNCMHLSLFFYFQLVSFWQ